MPVYLYGLILSRNTHFLPPHIPGLGGTSVRAVDCGALSAIAGTVPGAPGRPPALDDVRAHDHVLQCVVHHGCTACSVRFGQLFENDAELRTHVMEHGQPVRRALDEFDGCVEMRILLPDDSAAAVADSSGAPGGAVPGPGRAYLEGLKSARQPRGGGIRDVIGPLVRAEQVERLPRSRGLVYSHLIHRDSESRYQEVVAAIPALDGARMVGPLPLYSFAATAA